METEPANTQLEPNVDSITTNIEKIALDKPKTQCKTHYVVVLDTSFSMMPYENDIYCDEVPAPFVMAKRAITTILQNLNYDEMLTLVSTNKTETKVLLEYYHYNMNDNPEGYIDFDVTTGDFDEETMGQAIEIAKYIIKLHGHEDNALLIMSNAGWTVNYPEKNRYDNHMIVENRCAIDPVLSSNIMNDKDIPNIKLILCSFSVHTDGNGLYNTACKANGIFLYNQYYSNTKSLYCNLIANVRCPEELKRGNEKITAMLRVYSHFLSNPSSKHLMNGLEMEDVFKHEDRKSIREYLSDLRMDPLRARPTLLSLATVHKNGWYLAPFNHTVGIYLTKHMEELLSELCN